VGQHIAIERVHSRIVDIGCEHAFAQVVRHDDLHGATEFAERALVQFGPDAYAGLKGEKPDALAAETECQHEEPRAAILAVVGIADRRPVP
jgi:hypothetical protein